MNAQEILAQIDHAITEIDLVLHQWQEDLDMMSFIGVNATFEVWTNDIPPRLVTKDVLAQAAGKELRVMHRVDGAWTKIGTAKVDENGLLTAQIDHDIPELRRVPLKIRGLEEAIEKFEGNLQSRNLWPDDEELNNHPFFKKQNLWAENPKTMKEND